MVPGGTVAPTKFDPPRTSEGKSPTPSYGIGWPSKSDKTFEQLFGNLNLGTFSSE
jgi:hypothetical protein